MIGVTSYNYVCEAGFKNLRVQSNYIDEITKQGGVCVVLPTRVSLDTIKELAEKLDGLVLTGGNDISPCLIDKMHTRDVEQTDFDRDIYEIELYKAFSEKGKPVLGICRGMQLMSVLNNGDIIKDLDENASRERHNFNPKEPQNKVHKIELNSSFFRGLFETETIYVNSFHHQGIVNKCDNFNEYILMNGFLIEAIANEETKQMGFQWHPEMLKDKESEKIFKRFVEWCESVRLGI